MRRPRTTIPPGAAEVRPTGDGGAPAHRSGYATLVGHTNVGKSTLINRLVGEKIAIVAKVPQTTRTRITGILTRPEGQAVFVDTPGFHRPQHRMNRAMLETARQALGGVDLLLWVVDASRGFGPGDLELGQRLSSRSGGVSLFVVLNKVDLVRKPVLLPLLERSVREFGAREAFPVSATTGENCDALLRGIFAVLPEGPALFPADALTDQPERVLAAELIREKILQRTREEVPHAVAVSIDRWEEGSDAITRIDASILVEREGQKGILIGKGGEMLKEVGTRARLEMERLLGCRVGLRLWVRVRANWRDDSGILRELGIE